MNEPERLDPRAFARRLQKSPDIDRRDRLAAALDRALPALELIGKRDALAIPQVWGMAELRAHYPGLSEAEIKAALVKHAGVKFARGKRVSVHVDAVLQLDAELRRELGGRRG